MGEIAIGIDLGTSNSCVARSDGKTVEVLANGYGENITASVVSFQEDGAVTVGNSAKANLIHSPQCTIASAKRLIGRYFFSEEVKKAQAICAYDIVEGPGHGVRVVIRDEEFSLPEISAMILREMKHVAEERLHQPVTKAVITVPAYFNDNQRQATKDAGRIAGLEVLRLLNEPTAAALAYGFGRGLNQKVAVYDLGGGTFDISILEIGTDVFEVLATCGDTYLGGDDFDDRVIDLLADGFMGETGINLRKDMFALEKLKLAAENAKRGLSLEDEVEIRIPDIAKSESGEPLTLERTLTIAEFAQLVNDLILRTFKVCDEAMQQANVTTRDLEGVILVGGPTRLGIIREAVTQYFGQEPKTEVDPDEVVAKGASIHAASLVSDEVGDDDAFLLDVTPLSLKIGVAGGLAENVIERNTPVPIEQTRTFTTYQDMQESVKIKVFQGESRQAAENEMLGQFEFSGFEARARGQVQIDVTFEIDADGILSVTACDQETGLQSSTTITLNSGLSDEELDSILDEGRADRVQTASPAADAAADAAPPASAAPIAPPAAAPPAPVRSVEPDPATALVALGTDGDGVDELETDDLDDVLETDDELEYGADDLETGLAPAAAETPPVLTPPPSAPAAVPTDAPMETASAAEFLDDFAEQPVASADAVDLPEMDELDEMIVEPEGALADAPATPAAAPTASEPVVAAAEPAESVIEIEAEVTPEDTPDPIIEVDELEGADVAEAESGLFETDAVDLTDYGTQD